MDYEPTVSGDEEEPEAEAEEENEAAQRGQLGGRLRGLVGGDALEGLPDELVGESLLAGGSDLDLLFPGQEKGRKRKGRRRGTGAKKRKKKKKAPAHWYEDACCYALTWVTAHLEPYLESCGQSCSSAPVWSPACTVWDRDPRLARLVRSPTWSTAPRSKLGPFSNIPTCSTLSFPVVCKTLAAPKCTAKSPE